MNPKNSKKWPIHENADANITCDFGDGDISRSRSFLSNTCDTCIHTYIVSSIIVRWLPLILHHLNVQNNAARLILGVSKREHISPRLASLHWLPIDSHTSTNLHVFATTVCLLTLRPTSLTFFPFTPLHVSFTHLLTALSSICPYSILWSKVFRTLCPFYLELRSSAGPLFW